MNGELPQKKLPHARLNALAGLLEKLSLDDGRADLQHLGRALHFELVDLLPLVEAGELLGFIIPEDGALVLTQLVRTYADASILARKELLAGRVLRLPLINWIYDTLQRDDTQSRKSHLAKQYDAADKLDDLILLAVWRKIELSAPKRTHGRHRYQLLEVWQILTSKHQSNRSSLTRRSLNQPFCVQRQNHLVNCGRRDFEICLHVSFCGRTSVNLSVVVDEGEILTLQRCVSSNHRKSERQVLNDIFPIIYIATRNDDFKVGDHLAYRQPSGDNDDTGDTFTFRNPVSSVIWHGATIMSNDDACLRCRPSQQIRIRPSLRHA